MNLGEAKKRALSLMAEYSIDGTIVPDAENADYLNRMNRFANDAQMEISDKVGIELSTFYSQIGTSEEGYTRYDLPTNYKELRKVMYNDKVFTNFRIVSKKILFEKSLNGTFELIYSAVPMELTAETPDSYEFEVDKHVHYIIPYYLGGMAIHDENPQIADRLLNIYFSRLNNVEKTEQDYPYAVEIIYNVNKL